MTRLNPREHGAVLSLTLHDPANGAYREIPLRFVEVDGIAHVLASAAPLPEWTNHVQTGTLVWWRINGRVVGGHAEVIGDPNRVAGVVEEYRRRHGEERFSRWFPSGVICIGLKELGRSEYHAYVEAFFDSAAEGYDRSIEGNRADSYLRDVSIGVLQTTFRSGDRVLEIGCGTGLETLALARAGVSVVATDISGAMLRTLERKARAAGLADRVALRKISASEVDRILREFGPGTFDGAFSDFGALNTEPQLDTLPPVLAQLIRPNGSLVVAVWNRFCLSELALYALGLRPRRALARLRFPVPVGQSRFGVPVFPYSPPDFERIFAQGFAKVALVGLPVFVPPYDLAHRLPGMDRLFPLLATLDRQLSPHYPFRYFGDHFLLRLRRR